MAEKRPVFAVSFASLSLGCIFSANSDAFSCVCLAASSICLPVSWSAGCTSFSNFSPTFVAPIVASRATSDAPCSTFCPACCASLSVSLANSDLAISSLSLFAPSVTFLKPHDQKLFAAFIPFCILSTGKASVISFCIPTVGLLSVAFFSSPILEDAEDVDAALDERLDAGSSGISVWGPGLSFAGEDVGDPMSNVRIGSFPSLASFSAAFAASADAGAVSTASVSPSTISSVSAVAADVDPDS
mmetsp:Transcript_5703/g.9274  ORF Transcript_5703/g.9274 Transcript_5703/m.9274 type:complete len:244 (-) Transcript_5703:123-854(-)